MPDRYGFEHLGAEVRCIDCGERGPVWRLTEHERRNHRKRHEVERRRAAEARARELQQQATERLQLVNQLRREGK